MIDARFGSPGGYVAFISYSHKDAAAGRWLHRKLEGYRLPGRLAGTAGDYGEVPARLTPIFRDRDELPAAGDLSERVRAALARSRSLIVLCSPSSAASPWVAKEIATFRELHPDRPIYTAIVAGEPDHCFPPALRQGGSEPLAADLRKEGDGRRLGFLKLVAGLAGIGLDSLVQRDAARRIRRVTYVTAGAIAAMLVMALLTAIALNARAEAQRERSEAEGLVEFMLTDLRNRLRGVGRIEIMEAVNRRTLAYYRGQGSFSRRARILHAMGEDLIATGRLDAALPHFREAHRTTAGLLAEAPEDPERLLDHARSEYWYGRIHELRQEWPQAERQYSLFAAATDRLVSIAPDNAEYMKEAGWAAVDLGNVLLNGKRDAVGAQRSYQRAVDWFERSARARPADDNALRVLANAYAWLADSYWAQGLWQETLAARRRQHALLAKIHRRDPKNADLQYRFALAQRSIAWPLKKLGDHRRARLELFEAYGSAHRLAAQDPENAEWQLLRGQVGCDLLFMRLGRPPGVTDESLRREVKAAAARLAARRNPRAGDLSPCLRAIG